MSYRPRDREVLRARWDAEQAARVRQALSRDPPDQAGLPGGEHGADLRGLCLDFAFREVELTDLDFCCSLWRLPAGTISCSVQRCPFERATLQGNHGNHYVACSFVRAVLKRVWLVGDFVDCDFTGANLEHVKAHRVRFVRCRFVDANMKGLVGSQAIFEHCDFSGARFSQTTGLPRARFVGLRPGEVDFGPTLMEGVVFES